jgi:hypothetical protein
MLLIKKKFYLIAKKVLRFVAQLRRDALGLPGFPEGSLDICFNRSCTVIRGRFETEKRELGLGKQIVQEFVSLSPIHAPMRGIVHQSPPTGEGFWPQPGQNRRVCMRSTWTDSLRRHSNLERILRVHTIQGIFGS